MESGAIVVDHAGFCGTRQWRDGARIRRRKRADRGTDIPALVHFAREQAIDLTIIGPEAPLVAGIVDAFEAAALPCFGPRRAAAQLEGSKALPRIF
nr:hypothetical protein [Chromatium okenii]